MSSYFVRGAVLLLYLSVCNGGYTITTPRRWTAGESVQVCVTLTEAASEKDSFTVSLVTERKPPRTIAKEKIFALPLGKRNACYDLQLPSTSSATGNVVIEGSLLGANVSYSKPVSIVTDATEIFIQTDKYLYKPGQKVQFRILSVKGPFLQVLTEQYSEIWIENPSGSRIAQWLDVDNSKSLIHMDFQLSEEPEEGAYVITVQSLSGSRNSGTFKVEEYVLPRYEVIVKPPPYVLGTSDLMTFEVCAKYTFGQPVKGSLDFEVDNAGYGQYKITVEKKLNISGCEQIEISAVELNINSHNYHAYRLSAKATVTEDGTGVVLVSDPISVVISRTAISFKDLGAQKYYKPELPFIGEISARLPDESPAVNEPIKVCAGSICKEFATTAKGLVKFAIPPHIKDSIHITAVNYLQKSVPNSWRTIMYESSFRNHVKEYHSASNSSLVIALTEKKLKCIPGETISFELPVRFSAVNQGSTMITVQVISRGQFQFTSNTQQDLSIENDLHIPESLYITDMKPSTSSAVRGYFTIPINLPLTVSPQAKIIVWYARTDGEIISDQRSIDITKCLLNNVNLSWSSRIAKPGDTAALILEAEPFSLCSVGVVDKSVELLSSSKKSLTIQKLLEIADKSSVLEYENRQVNDYVYCQDKFETVDPIPIPPVPLPIPPIPRPAPPLSPPGAVPSPTRRPPVAMPLVINAARPAEEEIIRNKRSSPPRWSPYYSDDIDALHMFDEAGIYVFSDLTLETRPCRRHYGMAEERSLVIAYSLASPSFGIDLESEKERRSYFPETWLWDLLGIGDTGTLEQPLVLPDTVTEWVGQAVCVHPTKGVGLSETASITTFRDFFIDLTLPATAKRGETFPVKISVFNYLKDQLPVKLILMESPEYDILNDNDDLIGSGERFACINAEDKVVLPIRIKPKAVGDVNITIDAMVDINSVHCGTGATDERRDVIVKPVKVELEGFPKEKTWTKYICSKELEDGSDATEPWVMEPPASIVEDSARGWVTAVGDLMGPTIENLGGLVKMPYGCGEQNMLNFAPNIFVMQYLEASNQTTKDIAEKSISYMQSGYQRELNYRRSNGSYSAFGSRDDSGSTWLTAFVLRCFFQARGFIQIDQKDLAISSDWLKSKQLENGCFESVGRVLHKGMKGGIGNTESPSLLSAFVLISLMESGEDAAGQTVREALFCLSADKSIEPYALAVKAYALALAGSPDAQTTVDGLLSTATQSLATISWDIPESSKSGKGLGVETASYAILAFLALDAEKYSSETRRVVKWINNQRNGQGGFVSTQDTIIALQAMAAFARMLPAGPVDAVIIYTDKHGGFEESFNINERNKLLLQKAKLLSLPANVQADVIGEGCVLLQAILRYNIPEAEANEAFSISVKTSTPFDVSCKTKEITVCASYLLADKKSNMAIIEVNLVSGYIPVKEDLKRVIGYGTGLFKRYEVDGSTVTFYVDEFSAEELCANFKILREVDVENTKPGTVRVYDYYKPEYAVSKDYILPEPTDCVLFNEPPPLDLIELGEPESPPLPEDYEDAPPRFGRPPIMPRPPGLPAPLDSAR